jgi:hypothetical protein
MRFPITIILASFFSGFTTGLFTMRFAATIILTTLLSFAAGLYLPWWSMALVSFLVAFFLYQPRPRNAWLGGFLGLFLLWGLLAIWIDVQNDHILSGRMAILFPLGGSSALLILITALLAGLIGGLAALSGNYLFKYLLHNGSPEVKQFMQKLILN